MVSYSGWQWLLIDAANQYGKDKLRFEERIEWAEANLQNLENLADQAETKPLYIKAVMAIRKAQKGLPTGHMVAVDGVCSGAQLMSVLTGCVAGATATGLVDPDRRADAYTQLTDEMNKILGGVLSVSRKDAKQSLMTTLYGSKKTPETIFGKDTPEYKAFYQALQIVAPGAWALLQILLNSWNSYALFHAWKLPDGYDARVKVMGKKQVRIEVDELDHASFTYQFYENEGTKKGLSNAANVIHSVDSLVLKEMHRRCNYDKHAVQEAYVAIQAVLNQRKLGLAQPTEAEGKVAYYVEQYHRSTMASAVILPYLNQSTAAMLTTEHLEALLKITTGMLAHKPFPLVTVHDAFASHANNVNQVRWHYKEILADMAESNLLDDLLSQLYKEPCTFNKLSFNLPELIRNSNYALT